MVFEISKNQPAESERIKYSNIINKVTILWAFSEAALGGILHALHFPFTGMFIGSAAVIFISLISYYSLDKIAILKSTMIVLIVKGIISPYSPVTAYLAVFLQGLFGYLIFITYFPFKLSALFLGILSLLYSAFQKIIILTLVFGNNLWKVIDDFGNFLVKQFLTTSYSQSSINFSLIIISIYVGLHLLAGIFAGITGGKVPYSIMNYPRIKINEINSPENDILIKSTNNKRRTNWWQKKSGITFVSLAAAMIIVSYLNPGWGANKASEILIMLVRSVAVMVLWFSLISPLIIKGIKRIFSKTQSKYASEIENIMNVFPELRETINNCWKESGRYNGFKKIKYFLSAVIINWITAENHR